MAIEWGESREKMLKNGEIERRNLELKLILVGDKIWVKLETISKPEKPLGFLSLVLSSNLPF